MYLRWWRGEGYLSWLLGQIQSNDDWYWHYDNYNWNYNILYLYLLYLGGSLYLLLYVLDRDSFPTSRLDEGKYTPYLFDIRQTSSTDKRVLPPDLLQHPEIHLYWLLYS